MVALAACYWKQLCKNTSFLAKAIWLLTSVKRLAKAEMNGEILDQTESWEKINLNVLEVTVTQPFYKL